jgi:hypothetical protein
MQVKKPGITGYCTLTSPDTLFWPYRVLYVDLGAVFLPGTAFWPYRVLYLAYGYCILAYRLLYFGLLGTVFWLTGYCILAYRVLYFAHVRPWMRCRGDGRVSGLQEREKRGGQEADEGGEGVYCRHVVLQSHVAQYCRLEKMGMRYYRIIVK